MSYFMESERIRLRPVQKDDLKELDELMSDREIGVLSGEVYPMTEK
jgi:diamine N-acetyltransferase